MTLAAWLELDQVERVPLKDRMVVGRHASCDLVLPYPKLSRQHAMIFKDAQFFWVTDLNSRNGTWVGHRRVQQPVRLRSGEAISFDNYRVVFYQRSPTQSELEHRLASIDSNKATVCSDAFVTIEIGRVEVGSSGSLEHLDSTAERMLAEYFGASPGGVACLPAEVAKWMRSGHSERHPLCVRLDQARLVITHIVTGDRAQVILTEQVHFLNGRALTSLGITLTERRILKMLVEDRPAAEMSYATSLKNTELQAVLRELAHKVKAPSVGQIVPALTLLLGVDSNSNRPRVFNLESPLASQRRAATAPPDGGKEDMAIRSKATSLLGSFF